MRIKIDAVPDSPTFPEQADVVVIGGGIIGTSVAYELAKRGVSVALFEKGVMAGEQSGRNWGWVRQQNRDLYELPMAMYSLQRWSELGDEIGKDVGFRRSGILYGTTSASDLAKWESWGQQAKNIGFHSQLLSASEARGRIGGQTAWMGGVWSPGDGRAEPSQAVPALAVGAQQLGVNIQQRCAVRGLDISGGHVTGVWTERGLVKTSRVVCCGGAWSSRFCTRYGIALPSANILGTAFKSTVAAEVTKGCLSIPGLAIRRRLDGSYTVAITGRGQLDLAPQNLRYATRFYPMYRSKIAKKLKIRINGSFFSGPEAAGSWSMDAVSPFEKMRILDPAADKQILRESIAKLVYEFPQLAGIAVDHAWAGWIDTTPDLVPVIDEVSQIPGLIVASGFSGHGFGIGPGAGKLCSQLVLNEQTYTDLSPYRLSRFAPGKAIRQPQMM
ncbi:NAD(P)/FAD-dependent oxidoreductase [Erwinia psidii]|uniref:FAD-binding oxidoreductase n=1 Tax=Erwinia psidii TaxID=69224 RepID=A0A3N6RZ05_9GAMM|nr:FAD-binding oxidoreductase [Erwinia psidii]MCX8957800.1 FAD-binding oxidoreductase [Erwinia psidii]MCX8960849.1 FAD-binding oxidoreductase [Erwinia psidii]MCX8964911.1 FAD-binding oxidoreductase [Erwinia psidii]RQM38418.1 FAD-binding oxidoreductase [Erwinia psidii]